MNRTWRPGRIVLAVLLLSVAALMVYLWPKQPRWQFSFDVTKNFHHILSVDETRRLFYSRYMDFSSMEIRQPATPPKLVFEIRCYDLDTGKQVWSQPDPEDPTSRPVDLLAMCPVVLSPDHQQCAYVKSHLAEVQLYDFPPRTKRASLHFADLSPGEHLRVNYSPQGDWLLTRTDKQIFIYDVQTAKLIHQLGIPKEHIVEGGRGDWHLEQDSLLCSADKRYLVIANNNTDNMLVFDLYSKKMIGECKNMCPPRLLNDSKTLMCVPEYSLGESQAKWYSLEESAMVRLPVSTSEMVTGGYACSNSRNFVTAELIDPSSPPFWHAWTWLSDTSKMTLARWLGLFKFNIEVSLWNNNTGRLEKRFPILVSADEGLPTSGHRNWLLNDSSQMLLNVGTAIALWDLPPRRSLSCLLIALGITLVALWLAWPRRMKTTPPTRVVA
ncbi:MAG TPA: hypothetical protein PLN21_10475 [Gemmatales bacterium]|nr:hypothetical protein [Gemmatales bacterium]